jgi:hypothetical protein
MLRMLVVVVAAAVVLASCATPYADQGLLADVSRVKFQGNGYTTRESVQVYWLYRCAELALEKGFAGFEILSDMHFVTRRPPLDDPARSPLSSIVASLRTRIPVSPDEVADTAAWVDQADLTSRSADPIRMAHGGTFMRYRGGVSVPMASIEGDVHFLAGPVQSAPPKVFNA